MCGRFANDLPPGELARLFGTLNALPNIAPSWNIAPTQNALVVLRNPETSEHSLEPAEVGLPSYWTKERSRAARPTNARPGGAAIHTTALRKRIRVLAWCWYARKLRKLNKK